MDYLLPLEPNDALAFYGYLRLHNDYLYRKLHPIDEEYFKFEGCITHFFEIGMIYGEWKRNKEGSNTFSRFQLSFENEKSRIDFVNSLSSYKKNTIKEVKENIILFKCGVYTAFEIGVSYNSWLYNQQSKVNEVPRETLKPENVEKACKICVAVDNIVRLEAKQILELYQTLLENNL